MDVLMSIIARCRAQRALHAQPVRATPMRIDMLPMTLMRVMPASIDADAQRAASARLCYAAEVWRCRVCAHAMHVAPLKVRMRDA